MSAHWEHYPHEADVGIRGVGDSIETAFEQAAIALSAIVVDVSLINANESVDIVCQNPDRELLFADWINAIIYEMAVRKMLFCKFLVKIESDRLSAKIYGETINVKQHQPVVEIKGATFTTLKVYQDESGNWVAQTVVDV